MSQHALPLYDAVAFGHDSYVSRQTLCELIPFARRYWRVAGQTVSLELADGGGIIKPYTAFPDHCRDAETFLTFMDDVYAHDIRRPSSYSDLFHQKYRSPVIRWTHNNHLLPYFAGGWEQAKVRGHVRGHYRKYDLNSAYLWSLTQGLPDVRTFRFHRHCSLSDVHGAERDGVFVVTLARPHYECPYPFNTSRERCLASSHEIEYYKLDVRSVDAGVTWSRMADATQMIDVIAGLPASKNVARSYWGRWISQLPVHCHTKHKEWRLRNPLANAVWAHLIVSRVKQRVWERSANAVHVFVDSIITDDDLPVGDNLGDWRLEAEYPELFIAGAGRYGTSPTDWIKRAGHAA